MYLILTEYGTYHSSPHAPRKEKMQGDGGVEVENQIESGYICIFSLVTICLFTRIAPLARL